MNAARAAGLALVVALATTVGACSDAPLSLGADPDFLWWSDHESGDLSDWTRTSDTGSGATYVVGGDVAVSTDRARSGTHALRSTVTATGSTAAQIFRAGFGARAAYYGAWFSLPASATPASYWVFFSFHARMASGADVALWDVKLAPGADGLELALLHHDSGDVAPVAHVAVPLDRWFQVESSFVASPGADGRLQVWLDGALAFDVAGPTSPADPSTAPVTWTVGTNTDGLTPTPATLYIDDAYVSKRRLGPDFPVFWRP
ncbi:MAG TPA: heparin lyase I family protein [Polyangia bacterium]|nr:heparin lyase I family protein [Polyangia bacterium]